MRGSGRKLTLRAETLRELTDQGLGRAFGGVIPTGTETQEPVKCPSIPVDLYTCLCPAATWQSICHLTTDCEP